MSYPQGSSKGVPARPWVDLDPNAGGRLHVGAAMEEPKKQKRGFAAMDPEKRRAIASKGGQSVPSEKRSFSQSPELAAEAGRKGGQSVDPANRSFSRDPALAAKAGQMGGVASHATKPKAS